MSVNKVILVGNLGQDPEMRYTASGTAVCNLSLATKEVYQDRNGERQERTEWHRVVVWGKVGENCSKYLKKGRQVYLEGRLQTRSWEDKNGQKRYTTEINANNVQFLGSRPEGSQSENSYNNRRSPSAQNSSVPEENTMPEASPAMLNKGQQESAESNFTADDVPF